MKKLLMLSVAIFAICATSFAQVEAPAKREAAPSVEMKSKMRQKRGLKNESNTKRIPRNMRTASTPEQRTAKIVERINTSLIAKDPKMALTADQRTQLIDIHMQRQLVQQSRPKLETEEDKAAFMESRKAASQKFKDSMKSILTPEQAGAYYADREAQRAKRKVKKTMEKPQPKAAIKSKKF